MSVQIIPSESFSGQSIFSKPKLIAVFILCFPFGTGRISPAKLNSPITAVLSGNGMEVRAEYKAAAKAPSMALSVSFIPPATLI